MFRAALPTALPAAKLEAKFDLGHYLEQMDTFLSGCSGRTSP
jgi:hypothetical protein